MKINGSVNKKIILILSLAIILFGASFWFLRYELLEFIIDHQVTQMHNKVKNADHTKILDACNELMANQKTEVLKENYKIDSAKGTSITVFASHSIVPEIIRSVGATEVVIDTNRVCIRISGGFTPSYIETSDGNYLSHDDQILIPGLVWRRP